MKKLIRNYLINLGALLIVSRYITGFHIAPGWQSFLLVGLGFTLIHMFIKPFLNMLTGPLSFLTFGLIGIAIDAAILYALTLFFPQVWISTWNFPGLDSAGLIIAPRILGIIEVTVISAIALNILRSSIILLCD